MVEIDVLIQPVVLRFSLSGDEIVYHFAAGADATLDRMELLMGVDPAKQSVFDSNVGFLPVATTVLIRGKRNVVVDPGNHHTGFYGQLRLALKRFDLAFNDIDIVVATHSHHDHFASAGLFHGKELVVGEGELEFSRATIGGPETDAVTHRLGGVRTVPVQGELELCAGVRAVSTPGHTPGHICVVAENESERYLMTGDAAMTRGEFEGGVLSHWYLPEQLAEMQQSLSRMQSMNPSIVLPGHDRAFRVGEGA